MKQNEINAAAAAPDDDNISNNINKDDNNNDNDSDNWINEIITVIPYQSGEGIGFD